MKERKQLRRPEWLRAKLPLSSDYSRLRGLLRSAGLNTVCEEANCPNIGECFDQGTATFLILGNVCTRRCGFCAVTKGKTQPIDLEEPERLAIAVQKMGLKHVVVTSVTRDDIPYGGAEIYAKTIQMIRRYNPASTIEVLIPDFQGSMGALGLVIKEMPDVIHHNVETVPRLYKIIRPGALYKRSLTLLERVKKTNSSLITKSGLMVGLGEEYEEITDVMKCLREAGCDILTIGQYLSPGRQHLPVHRFYHPEEFKELKYIGAELGFTHVEAGPLVRSSYHARLYLA